ncbi:MAG: SAM-dependent methyltransferase [Clostridia bacterium]|nr:SAM-dependent methyltransferase [Clostridia bacterium]
MLDKSFLDRMKLILDDEYEEFLNALENRPPVRGARVNLVKCKGGEMPLIDGYTHTALDYVDNGYIIEGDGAVGRHPAHHSGMIYIQDPGAMSALAALDIPSDAWVADLCSAPGGKSSQVYERLGEGGFLLSNEYVPKRAKIIVSNFERLGVTRAIVTSMDTSDLADLYTEVFDVVVVDAPCSGEGMFRKNSEAIEEWTPDAPKICAKRQSEILKNAYRMLKPGGKLLYSTCTWSLEENEMTVLNMIDNYPDMKVIPVKDALNSATSNGVMIEGRHELAYTRRCYPHKTEGEGQYVALLEKLGEGSVKRHFVYQDSTKKLSKDEERTVLAFFREVFDRVPEGRLAKVGENIVLIPHDCPVPSRSVFMAGVLVGDVRKGILHPSHQLFSAYGALFKNREDLAQNDSRVMSYLDGNEIEAKEAKNGWCAVLYCGVALGGGKVSGGRIKNHYPKGLRNK